MSSKPTAPPLNDGSKNLNPKGIGFFALIKEDFVENGQNIASQGFWTLFWHRFGNARMSIKNRYLRLPFTITYKIMFKLCEILCGMKLSYNVPVGRRVRLEHFGGMVLGARAIGSDVIIRQNTTMGIADTNDLNAKPTIGNGVSIGAGAVIVGNIVIGDNAKIGANAVVLKSIPENAVAVGVPAKVVKSSN
ncbi:MAG: transferase [Blastomonas sp.]|nr:transferase [Blastomonas sp.]|tara:strand:- start:3051 stop:3623 length:573 start_codon:yes stop_codon:yes gene_type:complete